MSVKTSPRRTARREAAQIERVETRARVRTLCRCRTEGWSPYCTLHG